MSIEKRIPESGGEVFNASDANRYAQGCDIPRTSDYKIFAVETKRAVSPNRKIEGVVVNVCPGPGNECKEFVDLGVDRAIGVDASPTMIAHGQRRFPGEIAAGKIEFRQGWAQNLPVESGIAEGSTNFNSFHQFEDEHRALDALKEMVRVLKPGGWGFIRDFRRNVPPWRMDEFLKKRRSNVPDLLRESLGAAFTEDEFRDMLKQIDDIEFVVRKARDPRRIMSLLPAIAKDRIPHWLDFMISQNVVIRKLK